MTLSFGERLRVARERLDLSQEEAAREAKVSRNTWWAWENGRRWPHLTRLPELARVVGVSTIELMP